MALLPFFRRDNNQAGLGDLSPWRDLDERLSDLSGVGGGFGFPRHFRSQVGGILREMDDSIARMDEEMRRVMRTNSAISPANGKGKLTGTGSSGYEPGSLLQELHTVSPTITTDRRTGQEVAHYDFDVTGYRPDEITVKTQDGTLEVIARHEERTPGREVSREFKRTFTIPEGISPDELQGSLVKEGVLRVEAPYRPPRALTQYAGDGGDGASYMIPITHQSSGV